MRTPSEVHHELNEAIKQLEWAELYARTASLESIEHGNARLFRRKLDRVACLVQSIEAKLPKPKEVKNVHRPAA